MKLFPHHVRPAAPATGLRFLATCLLATLSSGCDLPDRPPMDPASVRQPLAAEDRTGEGSELEILEPPGASFDGRWEAWDAYFIANRHVGYARLVAEAVDDKTRPRKVRYSAENHLYLRRGQARVLQRLEQISTETFDGRLLVFESALHVGPAVTRFTGTIEEDQLRIETLRGSARLTRTIPWQSTYRGPTALEQSLRRTPMTSVGERRSLRLLLPGQYELATARLRFRGPASIPQIDGTPIESFEIDAEVQRDDNPAAYSTLWTDAEGRIVRSLTPELQLLAYRTDRATATTLAEDDSVPLAVAISGELINPADATRVAFQVKPLDSDLRSKSLDRIPAAPGQYVRETDDGMLQVLVSRQKERVTGGFKASDLSVVDADSTPNFFVDSKAPLIRRLVDAAVTARDLSDREVAVELAQTVNRAIADQSQSRGFTRASEIVQEGLGDNTGKAVLLAAMLRAAGLPSRIAIGLKYAPGQPNRMVYHAWALAHVDGQWLSLDAGDKGIAAADRLTMTTTNLAGGSEYNAMIPLLDIAGRIEIEVVGQR